MENKNPTHEVGHSSPPSKGTSVQGDVNTGGGHFIGRDNIINIGGIKIPRAVALLVVVALVISLAAIGFIALNTFAITGAVTAPTPTATATVPTATPTTLAPPTATPLAFATSTPSETLILLATFHNTAANNVEAHKKIQRAIAAEVAEHGVQRLRVAIEPTELTADQRLQAEALGKRYNASMVIWGEDTGVEVIVNFLNLKEPDFDTAAVTVTERERTQLANPSAYARFITDDLPRQITFFALLAIGRAYHLNEEYPRALAQLEAAVAMLLPTEEPDGLAEAYFSLGWLYHVATKQLDQAITAYDKAIALDPENSLAYSNRGIAHSDRGELTAAIADYDKAIALDPSNSSAYLHRGLARRVQGELTDALADYDKAIALDPTNAFAYNNRGNVHYGEGEMAAAIADYDKVIALDPDFAWAYYNRGNVHYVQGELTTAIADYNKAISRNLNDAWVYTARGNTLADQGELAAAIADYDKAISLDPDYAAAYHGLCWNYSLQGQPELALPHCQHAIELDPAPKYYDSQGLAYALLGDFPAAIADFQKSVDFLESLNDPAMSQLLESRKGWITTLKADRNPFTPAVLEALKQE